MSAVLYCKDLPLRSSKTLSEKYPKHQPLDEKINFSKIASNHFQNTLGVCAPYMYCARCRSCAWSVHRHKGYYDPMLYTFSESAYDCSLVVMSAHGAMLMSVDGY